MLVSTQISNACMSIAESLRGDLYVMYFKYVAEIMKFSQKGAKIMIDNKWLEQPPDVIKHKDLVEIKK